MLQLSHKSGIFIDFIIGVNNAQWKVNISNISLPCNPRLHYKIIHIEIYK